MLKHELLETLIRKLFKMFSGVIEEARYFGVDAIIPQLETLISSKAASASHSVPLNRRDVIDALIRTPSNRELRVQGVNLQGADLSRLDLRHINFK